MLDHAERRAARRRGRDRPPGARVRGLRPRPPDAAQRAWRSRWRSCDGRGPSDPFTYHGELLPPRRHRGEARTRCSSRTRRCGSGRPPRAAAARAGRHGCHLAPGRPSTPRSIAAYAEALAAAGHDRSQFRVLEHVVDHRRTDEDPDEVWARNKDLYYYRWDFYRKIRAEFGDPDLALRPRAPAPDVYRDTRRSATPTGHRHAAALRGRSSGLTDLGVFGPPSGSTSGRRATSR